MINLSIVTHLSRKILTVLLTEKIAFSSRAYMYVLRMPIYMSLGIGTIGCASSSSSSSVFIRRVSSFASRILQEKRDVLADPLSVSARFTFVHDTLFESRDIFRSALSVSCKQMSF